MSALTMATTMDTPMVVTDLLAASSTPSWSSSVPGLAIGGGIGGGGGGIAPKKIVKKKKGKSRVGVATSTFEAEHGGGVGGGGG